MAIAKPLASLSSGLLARKGHARPAMRSQGFAGFGGATSSADVAAMDDLGWNDMGHEPAPAPVAEPVPQVLVDREALAAAVAVPPVVKTISIPTATRLQRESAHAGKAAFTLRVDADRHLRLRLASAITNRSAQDLVTAALDALIQSMPEVDALVAQLPTAKHIRNR